MLEKIQTYILTRVNLLYTLCYEIPCNIALNSTTMIKQQFLLVVPNICTKHLHNTRSASKVYAYHSYKS